ncbi:MAG: GNAT family N-acetyltransferase [Candidatus Limnocylindrales bacterium]
MPDPRLRPMSHEDIDRTSAAILADDWGDRRSWFAFAVRHPACRVVVAEADGAVVGTGVTTINGNAAWIGTIWVATPWRGRGLGRTLTQATIDAAEAAGCRTLILVATDAGRPLYERLGFTIRSWYRTMEAPGRGQVDAPPAGDATVIRDVRATDLDVLARLDAAATGEDRAHLLQALAKPGSTRVVVRSDDRPQGFIVRAPWGGGATIAPDPDLAMAMLDARRDAYPADRKVRAGVLDHNRAGLARLEAEGWTEAWRAPRLERGDPLDWEPTSIWGQFNHALG